MAKLSTSFNSVYNFIINFKPEEINDVISDFELREKGYEIFYAVDTYDIISHYLPYTEGNLFQNKNKNELAQKLICYDYFFSVSSKKEDKKNTKNIIILDEYKIELLTVKNKLQKQLKDATQIVKNLSHLKNATSQFKNNLPGADTFFEKNFELILLLLILSEKKDFIHLEFDYFLKTRLSIFEINTGSEDKDKILNDLFSESRHSKLSLLLFDEFIHDNKLELISLEKSIERYIYLENTFRDIQAIDRLVNINNKLANSKEKYIVLYLSSTPYKTKELFRSLNNLNIRTPLNLNDSKKINPLGINRNIYQCFLFEILSKEFTDTSFAVIKKSLYSLKTLSSKIEKKETSKEINEIELDSDELSIINKLKNIFDVYSATLDNHFYIKIYEKYKSVWLDFNSVSGNDSKKKLKKDTDILKYFELIDNFINKENFKQKLFDFSFTITQLKQAIEITNVFDKTNPLFPNIDFGNDIIKNSFHHLPYLLFINEKNNYDLIENLYKLLNELIDISYPDHVSVNTLHVFLKDVIKKLTDEHTDISLMSFQQIVISYINLVTVVQPSKLTKKGPTKEIEIIEGLEKQKEIFNHINPESLIERKENKSMLNVDFRPSEFSKEIDYILLWLYRRNNRIDEGIELGKSLISKYPSDARYFHGLALCFISKAYDLILGVSDIEENREHICSLLKKSFTYLKICKDKYELFIDETLPTNYGILILKNYMAVLNSLADVSVRIYEMEKTHDYSRIKEARLSINQLKLVFTSTDLVYNKYPIFSATELEIEYFEALYFFEQKRFSEAHQKIINAQSRVIILKENITKAQINSKFSQVQNLVQKLALMIYKSIARK